MTNYLAEMQRIDSTRKEKEAGKKIRAAFSSAKESARDAKGREVLPPVNSFDYDTKNEVSRAYVLGKAHQIMKDATNTGNIPNALHALDIYKNLGKGTKPYVLNGLLETYRTSRDKEMHFPQCYHQWIRDAFQDAGRSGESRLEKATGSGTGMGVTALVGLVGGIFFLSSNVTGNAISNLSNATSSWIGGVLFCAGVVGCFFWIKSRK